ncbi:hypothetical protein IG631_20516 [Alternaria alternata]|nr:hypothetical protein IG631_20516 [Alternaria alternata]
MPARLAPSLTYRYSHGDAASRRFISARNTTPPRPALTAIHSLGCPGTAPNRPPKDSLHDKTRWLNFWTVFHQLFFASAFSDRSRSPILAA